MTENEQKTINVVLTGREINIVNTHVEETGLGGKGFSAAVRQIIREWDELTNKQTAQPIATPTETK